MKSLHKTLTLERLERERARERESERERERERGDAHESIDKNKFGKSE